MDFRIASTAFVLLKTAERLPLDRSGCFWLLESGEVDIFLLEERTTFLFSASARSFIFPFPRHGQPHRTVIAVATKYARIRKFSLPLPLESVLFEEKIILGMKSWLEQVGALIPDALPFSPDGHPLEQSFKEVEKLNGQLVSHIASKNAEKQSEHQMALAFRAKKENLKLRMLSASVQNLFKAAKDNLQNFSPEEKLTVKVCNAVGKDSHLHFVEPKGRMPINFDDKIDFIASGSSIHKRKVYLHEGWWKSDCGNIVGMKILEQGTVPLPLLRRFQGYVIAPVELQEGGLVDSNEASKITSSGYMFYRSYPFRQIVSAWNLFRFALGGRGEDLFIGLLASFFAVAVSLLIPIANNILFDYILPNGDWNVLFQIVCGLIAVSVLGALFVASRELAILRLEGYFYHDIECALWQRLLQLPLSFFRSFSTGALLQRLEGMSEVREILSNHAIRVTFDMAFSCIYLVAMWYYSPQLTFLLCSLLLGVGIIFFCISIVVAKIYRQMAPLNENLYGKTVQMIVGISKIRTNGAENRIFVDWMKNFLDIKRLEILEGKAQIFFGVISGTLSLIVFLLVLLAFLLWNGHFFGKIAVLSVASYISFASAFALFSTTLVSFYHTLMRVIGCMPLWQRSQTIFEAPSENLKSVEQERSNFQCSGELFVNKVYFRYDSSAPYVLSNISLRVYPGEFIAIVGASGCGKSTLVRLLLGFEKSEMGEIYYDKKNLNELDVRAVRNQVGVVLQNSMILHGNIRENITGGRSATDEEVDEAVRLAELEGDLAKLPMGLKTPLMSGGAGLSGGQQQRIFLARALLGKPKILILDEATNALDNKTQEAVTHNFEACAAVTRIVIAHRLSTIQRADRIYVMEKGSIVQEGTFEVLSAREGVFKRFVEQQKL